SQACPKAPPADAIAHPQFTRIRCHRPIYHRADRRRTDEHVGGHPMRPARRLILLTAALILTLGGCDWPHDPEETLSNVQNGGMRVGIADCPPFAQWNDGQPHGVEVELIKALAADL